MLSIGNTILKQMVLVEFLAFAKLLRCSLSHYTAFLERALFEKLLALLRNLSLLVNNWLPVFRQVDRGCGCRCFSLLVFSTIALIALNQLILYTCRVPFILAQVHADSVQYNFCLGLNKQGPCATVVI